jgi:hypothetical protein
MWPPLVFCGRGKGPTTPRIPSDGDPAEAKPVGESNDAAGRLSQRPSSGTLYAIEASPQATGGLGAAVVADRIDVEAPWKRQTAADGSGAQDELR